MKVAKITKKSSDIVIQSLEKYLLSIGAKKTTALNSSYYGLNLFQVETKVGSIDIKLDAEVNSQLISVFCRVDNFELAKPKLGLTTSPKYNYHCVYKGQLYLKTNITHCVNHISTMLKLANG